MTAGRMAPLRGLPAISPSGRVAGAALVLLLFLFALPAFAQSLPALTGRVVDNAGIIDAATEASLTSRLEAFEKKSSDQIVVATIQSLGENNGVLLLVAVDDRKMRIEVGYGLEGTLTDLHSKLIIENTMVPAFRAGDFSGGISKAVDDIVMVLEGNGAELEARAERNQPAFDYDTLIPIAFFILWGTIFFGGLFISIAVPRFGTKIGPRRYRWLGMTFDFNSSGGSGSSGGSSWSSGSSGGGGFSGGGGSSGGGGASGGW